MKLAAPPRPPGTSPYVRVNQPAHFRSPARCCDRIIPLPHRARLSRTPTCMFRSPTRLPNTGTRLPRHRRAPIPASCTARRLLCHRDSMFQPERAKTTTEKKRGKLHRALSNEGATRSTAKAVEHAPRPFPAETGAPLGSAETASCTAGLTVDHVRPETASEGRNFRPLLRQEHRGDVTKHNLGKWVASGRADISAGKRQTAFTRFTQRFNQLTVLVTLRPLRTRSVRVYHRPRDCVLRFMEARKCDPTQSDVASDTFPAATGTSPATGHPTCPCW